MDNEVFHISILTLLYANFVSGWTKEGSLRIQNYISTINHHRTKFVFKDLSVSKATQESNQ